MSVKQMTKNLLITTLDPTHVGGIATVCNCFLEWARTDSSLHVELAFSSLRRRDPVNVTIATMLRGKIIPSIQSELLNEMSVHRVGSVFPRIESMRYEFNLKLWANLLKKFRWHQIISGFAIDAYPHASLDIPFILFVASDLQSERTHALRGRNIFIRELTHLQMKRLLRIERFVLEKAQWVYTCSPWVLERLQKRGAKVARSSVLNIPIDPELWYFNRATPNYPHTIVWAGRLSDPRKNTELLLRVFSKVLKKNPNAMLNLIGPMENNSLEMKAVELGVSHKVQWMGEISQDARRKLFQSATLFVIPSHQEGLCIAGLEAMACGLPVVSMHCGGAEHFVLPGRTGVLVNNELELENSILEAFSNPEIARQLGIAGSEWVKQNFNFSDFVQTLNRDFAKVF